MTSCGQLKQQLNDTKKKLCEEFTKNHDITNLINQLVGCVDTILLDLFKRYKLEQASLLAVGSYGRRELILHSDIDIILLHDEAMPSAELKQCEKFIRGCWDAGLQISHQLTTVNQCADLAEKDITVISTLIDARHLCGSASLFENLNYLTHQYHMWPTNEYFSAKLTEQKKRHSHYDESAYHLEPDIKSGPGGLRDLQTFLLISKRHYHIDKLSDCISVGLLTEKEYETIYHCQLFLWRVRFGLHIIANRAEERLLFDRQVELAKLLQYKDDSKSLSLEKFMQNYFQTIKTMREFNSIFNQLFDEAILYKQKQQLTPINERFRLSNNFIEVTHPNVFFNRPSALLEVFILMARNESIKNIRANTIRLIRKFRYLIDSNFRENKKNNRLFMDLIRHSHDVYQQLHSMNRHGVLGQYIIEFNHIIGQMQYDLFHIYTVDQHTLFVIRNLVRFHLPEYQQKFPLCHQIIQKILKPELLTISALFHDIAKGRGGDHSELGAQDSYRFCQRHDLVKADCDLVSWLVKNHLLMSKTIQQQDIYDPLVIAKFCQIIPKPHYIDYLYCLTVADICATNAKLWNSWKDSLLRELYSASKHHIEQQKLDRSQVIATRKQQAMSLLLEDNINKKSIDTLWQTFKGRYFLFETPASIARQTKDILTCSEFPLIEILPHHSHGSTEVFIYMPYRPDRFIIATTILSNFHANIHEANITSCNNQFILDTYIILDADNKPINDDNTIKAIYDSLNYYLSNEAVYPRIHKKRLSRQQAHFAIKPEVTFSEDSQRQQTQLVLTTADKPGLLAKISRVFAKLEVELHNAKIATAGERVQDTFIITNKQGKPLDKVEQLKISQALINAI